MAVIGTGKRTGKTAVSAQLARVAAGKGISPVIVAMGRGGPAEPELVDPASFDLSPKGIIKALSLRAPIYRATATYGHFGRAPERRRVGDRDVELFTWEQTNRVEDLRLAVQRSHHYQPAKATR